MKRSRDCRFLFCISFSILKKISFSHVPLFYRSVMLNQWSTFLRNLNLSLPDSQALI